MICKPWLKGRKKKEGGGWGEGEKRGYLAIILTKCTTSVLFICILIILKDGPEMNNLDFLLRIYEKQITTNKDKLKS